MIIIVFIAVLASFLRLSTFFFFLVFGSLLGFTQHQCRRFLWVFSRTCPATSAALFKGLGVTDEMTLLKSTDWLSGPEGVVLPPPPSSLLALVSPS